MKRCSSCKQEKPFDQFNKDRTKKDGYLNICKPCKIAMKAKWQNNNKDKQSQYHLAWINKQQKQKHYCSKCGVEINSHGKCESCKTKKTPERIIHLEQGIRRCPGCTTIKPITDFRNNGSKEKHRYSYCKECDTKRQQGKHQKRMLFRGDEIRLRQREVGAKYRNTEHGKASMIAGAIKRRERESKLDNQFTPADAGIVYRQFKFKCFKCGGVRPLNIDHHYPMSKGNALTVDNAVLLCSKCNGSSGKWNKEPEKFYSVIDMAVLAFVYGKKHTGRIWDDAGLTCSDRYKNYAKCD